MSVRKNATSSTSTDAPGGRDQAAAGSGNLLYAGNQLGIPAAGKRYVLRGRESGGAIHQLGRYVTFCGEQGQRLPWFLRPDSVTPNAEHAIVIAPALVSVEMFRIEHTYELLVARHQSTR